MIRNIIWDLDGTLFDTYPAIIGAFQRAFRDHSIHLSEGRVSRHARRSLTRFSDLLITRYKIDREEFYRHYLEYYDKYPVVDQPPFPGVHQVCQFICSRGGKNVIITHRRASSAHLLLRTYQMESLFAGLLTADDGYPLKPDPAMFEIALNRFSLPQPDTLAVGDRDIDIEAGRAAGLLTCLYCGEPSEADPDIKISDYAELLAYLEQQHN